MSSETEGWVTLEEAIALVPAHICIANWGDGNSPDFQPCSGHPELCVRPDHDHSEPEFSFTHEAIEAATAKMAAGRIIVVGPSGGGRAVSEMEAEEILRAAWVAQEKSGDHNVTDMATHEKRLRERVECLEDEADELELRRDQARAEWTSNPDFPRIMRDVRDVLRLAAPTLEDRRRVLQAYDRLNETFEMWTDEFGDDD